MVLARSAIVTDTISLVVVIRVISVVILIMSVFIPVMSVVILVMSVFIPAMSSWTVAMLSRIVANSTGGNAAKFASYAFNSLAVSSTRRLASVRLRG